MKLALIPLFIVLFDQATKWLVIQRLPLYEDVPLISGLLSLQHVRNSGAVFGFLSGADIPFKPYLFAVMSALALAALTYYARTVPAEEKLPRFALSLVIGGAIGNLIDRVRFGYVVDFVKMYWDTHVWPNYNVADSAISIGLVLLIIDSFRPRDREPQAAPKAPPSLPSLKVPGIPMFPKLFTIPSFDLLGRTLGPFSLHMYGVLLVAALLAALWLAGRLARREGLDGQKVQDLGIASIIAGLVGAKLLLVIIDFDQYRASPRALLDVLQSGGVFYGGLLGALPVAWWYIRKHGLPLLPTLDVMAPAVALGQAIGRLGCFAAGCCFGSPSTAPWSVIFHSEDAHALVGVPLGVPLHPSQLYESLGTAILLVILLAVLKNRKFPGQVAALYLIFYAILRFGLEFFRGDVARGTVFGGVLSTSQFIALLVVFLTLAALPIIAKRKPETV